MTATTAPTTATAAPAATTEAPAAADRGIIASVRRAGDAAYRAALRATATIADKLRVTPKSVRTTAITVLLIALVAVLLLTSKR